MADLSTRLRDTIESAAEAVRIEEIFESDLGSPAAAPVAARGQRRRLTWWAAAAAIVVVIAGMVVLVDRGDQAHHAVKTPDGPVTADSYPTTGETCGESRVDDGVQYDGTASARACIGIAAIDTGTTTVYVTSSDGARIYGGWVLDGCSSPLSASGQLELGNDDSPMLMMGAVGSDVAAVQYRLRNGTLVTAETAEIAGVADRRFYAVQVPANPTIVDELLLAADGSEVTPPVQRCQAPQLYLPDDVVETTVASYIAESSEALGGVEVGDPCPTAEAVSGVTPSMSMLIDGDVNTPECIIVGWMPLSGIPGIPMGYYGQDGTILWPGRDPSGDPPPKDLREQALDWAAAH